MSQTFPDEADLIPSLSTNIRIFPEYISICFASMPILFVSIVKSNSESLPFSSPIYKLFSDLIPLPPDEPIL